VLLDGMGYNTPHYFKLDRKKIGSMFMDNYPREESQKNDFIKGVAEEIKQTRKLDKVQYTEKEYYQGNEFLPHKLRLNNSKFRLGVQTRGVNEHECSLGIDEKAQIESPRKIVAKG